MSEKEKRLEGRVAAVLNAREVVINIGGNHGVSLGMKFAILAEKPLEIRDPSSGEVLDTVDREKVRVQATELRPRISICRTYRVRKIAAGPLGVDLTAFPASVLDELMRPARKVPETLAISDADALPPLPEEESYVKIGDRVVQVEDSPRSDD